VIFHLGTSDDNIKTDGDIEVIHLTVDDVQWWGYWTLW